MRTFPCDHCQTEFSNPIDGDLWITELFPGETLSICLRCRQAMGSSELDTVA